MVAVLKSLQDEYFEKRSSFIKPLGKINKFRTIKIKIIIIIINS